MKELLLNQKCKTSPKGFVTLVDDEDFEFLNQFNWTLTKHKRAKTPYVMRTENTKGILMHRQILKAEKDEMIDHIDGNGLNNQKSNLRFCTQSQNNYNSNRKGKFGYKGIYYKKTHNRFIAVIYINKKPKVVGRCKTAMEAAIIYNQFALKYYGDFAKLNNIFDNTIVYGNPAKEK